MRKFTASVLILTIMTAAVLLSSYSCRALTAAIDGCGEIVSVQLLDDDKFCILGIYNDNYKITTIDSDLNIEYFPLDIRSLGTPYAYFDGTFCFFTSCAEDREGVPFFYVTVNSIDLKTSVSLTRIINYARPQTNTVYAYDGRRCFLLGDEGICVYSEKFKLAETIPVRGRAFSLAISPDGNTLYCPDSDGVMIVRGDDIAYTSIRSQRVYPFGSNFADDSGHIYDGSGTLLYDGFNCGTGAAEMCGSWIGCKDGVLTAVSGDKSADLGQVSDSCFICGGSRICACFSQNGGGADALFISESDIENSFREKEVPDDTPQRTDSDTAISERFIFDAEKGIVTGIERGMTAAQLRRISGRDITVLKKDGSEASGTLGTGMSVRYDREYTVVIFGDVTGEGSINSRDLRAIEDHILDSALLEEYERLAADADHDGKIGLSDAAAVYRAESGRYEIPQDPTVQ